jgi:protein-tyrosine-phosphatase
LNKQAVWDLAHRLGVGVPSSQLISSESPPPDAFPVVLKPVFSKRTTYGRVQDLTVSIVRDIEQWRTALASTYRDIPIQQQQYISGKGIGVEMLFENGDCRWSFLHERVHELPLTGGGSSYRVSLPLRDDLIASSNLLLSALRWHGVAMVEFKVTPNGEAYLMEINPRLWGSLALAIDCGVNFPSGLLNLSTGRSVPPQPQYRVGYYTRNIYRDVEWFKTNLKADRSDPVLLTKPALSSIFEWLRPLVGKESWDFFCWSDSGIVLGELKKLFKEHWVRVVNVLRRRSRRLYLRHIQQPRMLRKLRGQKIDKVLVLCHGNICRSPLAAALAARRYPSVSFASGGFYPETGRHSPSFVVAAGDGLGVDLTEHRSKCVDAKLMGEARLVLIMDIRNYEQLAKAFPDSLDKTLFLGMLLPNPKLEIKDPYDNPASMPAVAREIDCAIERAGKCWATSSRPESFV